MAGTARSGNSASSKGGSGSSKAGSEASRTSTGGRSSGGREGGGQGGKGGKGGKGRGAGGRGGGGGRGRTSGPDDRVAELAGPLGKVLDRLPETQRRVLEYRMGLVDGHPHSLADTATALGLGQSEARDIEARAFDHIREVIPLDRLGKLLGT